MPDDVELGDKRFSREIVYDVFALADRPFLLALATRSPLIWERLSGLKICLDGRPVRFVIQRSRSGDEGLGLDLAMYTSILIPLPEVLEHPVELRFEWREFAQTVVVQPNIWKDAAPAPTLWTKQKDNRLQVISDWCLYHHRVHGIRRIVIYNNKPDIEPELLKMAGELDEGLELVLVVWPYRFYVPELGTSPKHFKEYGLPNKKALVSMHSSTQILCDFHSYWWLATKASCFLYFDVDEFVVNNTGVDLIPYCEKQLRRKKCIYVFQRRVPNAEVGAEPRAASFSFAEKECGYNTGLKKIYAPEYWHFLSPHNAIRRHCVADMTWWMLVYGGRSRWKRRLAAFLHRRRLLPVSVPLTRSIVRADVSIRRRLEKVRALLSSSSSPVPRVPRGVSKHTAAPSLYFNHYKGLTAYWKHPKDHPELAPRRFDPQVHIKDDKMAAVLREAGLADSCKALD